MSAPAAVEWLADASPKLHSTIASSGQGDSTPVLPAEAEGVGQADRPGQVGADRGGLGDDAQPRMAEDLVPATGHRVAAAAEVRLSRMSRTGSSLPPTRARAA